MVKKAIIIGVSGQDGAYLAELLLQKGYKVFGVTRDVLDYDDKRLRYLSINNEVEIIELSSLDKDRIIKVLKKINPGMLLFQDILKTRKRKNLYPA